MSLRVDVQPTSGNHPRNYWYDEELLSKPTLLFDLLAHRDHVTITDGKVSAATNRAGGPAIAQSSPALQPVLTDGAFATDWPGLVFTGAERLQVATPDIPNLALPFSWAAIIDVAAIASTQALTSSYTAAGQLSEIRLRSDGKGQFSHGNANVVGPDIPTASSVLIMGGHNTSTAFSEVNGEWVTGATNNNAGTSAICIGAENVSQLIPFVGVVKRWQHFSTCLWTSDLETLDIVRRRAKDVYGAAVVGLVD